MVTILVPLDSSRFGEAALSTVKKLVRLPEDRVVLTQICHPPDKPHFEDKTPFEEELHTLRDIADEYLREVRLRLEADGLEFLQFDVEVRTGEPVSEIVALATEKSVDLILMATHGRTGSSVCCSAASRVRCCVRRRYPWCWCARPACTSRSTRPGHRINSRPPVRVSRSPGAAGVYASRSHARTRWLLPGATPPRDGARPAGG